MNKEIDTFVVGDETSTTTTLPEENREFTDTVFSTKEPTTLPPIWHNFDFVIHLKEGARPPKLQKNIPMSDHQKTLLREWIDKMIKNGHVRPSTSEYGTPYFWVKKKGEGNGLEQHRLVVDWWQLNDIIIKDEYSISPITGILDDVQGSTIFSKFDLKDVYNSIWIWEENCHKTTFQTPFSLYEFTVMHFRFKNASAHF